MDNENMKFPYFKVKALTIRDCLDKGIRRIYDPNWLEKDCYIKLPLKIDNKYSPWIELYSEETQEMLGVKTPQQILFDQLHGGLESICLEYTGKLSKYDQENDAPI